MIYLGTIVNTHGIKGELRIISNFKYKSECFKTGNTIYISNEPHIINSYRQHKNYDMITIDNINDINDVIKYKGEKVYIKKENLNIDLITDLIGYKVYQNTEYKGIVTDVLNNKVQDILLVSKKYMIIYLPNFIKNVKKKKKEIMLTDIGGIFYEN